MFPLWTSFVFLIEEFDEFVAGKCGALTGQGFVEAVGLALAFFFSLASFKTDCFLFAIDKPHKN